MTIIIFSILITFFSFIAGISFVPMHSILSMLLTYLCTGLLFMYLGLEFIGLIYIIVYAGAVVILFIFILMLTNQPYKESNYTSLFGKALAYLYSLAILFLVPTLNSIFNSD